MRSMQPYTDDQTELIEAQQLQPGQWLVMEGHRKNQAILVEPPVLVHEDSVIVFCKIVQFPSGMLSLDESRGSRVVSIFFDVETSNFQSALVEWHYRLGTLLRVLKPEYAPGN
jgi:hypothetical protein